MANPDRDKLFPDVREMAFAEIFRVDEGGLPVRFEQGHPPFPVKCADLDERTRQRCITEGIILRGESLVCIAPVLAGLHATTATSAMVTQPNGLVTPRDSGNGEIQLFTMFSNLGQPIDPIADAASTPTSSRRSADSPRSSS